MATFIIRKGRDIKLKGAAFPKIVDLPLPQKVAVVPADFRGIKPRLNVKVGDAVRVGTPVLSDKNFPEIRIPSPVSGRVMAINRGDKRVILNITISADGKQDPEVFEFFTRQEIPGLKRDSVIKTLCGGGLWPAIRQRPFSRIAHPQDHPKAIFIHAMNTEPLAPDMDFILEKREEEFQAGLDILKCLTDGPTYLCVGARAASKALTQAKNVITHKFSGPHPAGNVSTHIHCIDPIKKGDVVWYIEAQDVLRVAHLFLKGTYPVERTVALTGEDAPQKLYVRTILGVPLAHLLKDLDPRGKRIITGSVLTGTRAGIGSYLGYYDSQITVIPEGGERKFLGWLALGGNVYSFSKTYLSSFLPQKEAVLDTDEKGSHRAIVMNHVFDEYVPLDIMTFFLLRAILSSDIEEAEKLGILECDEEDFALCTFACPSKTDVGGIIRRGLDLIEKEG